MPSEAVRARRFAPVFGAGLVVAVTAAAGPPAQTANPPSQPGAVAAATVAAPECLACHGEDFIAQQRLSAAGWAREVDKMIRWGAAVAPERREALAADLAWRLACSRPAVAPVGAPGPAPAGEEVSNRACVVCHGPDLIEQQRLTPAGWAREVAKMAAWGAPVAETERAALSEYLAARFPPP